MTRKSTITKELAIIERKLSETTNQVLKDALKKKQERLKSELKDASKTAPQLAQNLLSQKAKVKALSKIDFNDLVRRLAKKPEYSFLKSMSKSTVRTDLERKAKPVGWRFKGRGNYDKPTMTQVAKGKKSGAVYREARPIRSDVNLNVRLKHGGMIGDNGTITDPKSMYQGKMGFIEMDMGNELIVKVLDNGKEKSVTVRKSGFKVMHDDKMSNGGNILSAEEEADFDAWFEDGNVEEVEKGVYATQDYQWNNRIKGKEALKKFFAKEYLDRKYATGGLVLNIGNKTLKVGETGTYGRKKESITITGFTPKLVKFKTSDGKEKGIYFDYFIKSYIEGGSKNQAQSSQEPISQKTSIGRITMDDKMKLSAYKKLELRKKELKLSKDRYKYEKAVLDNILGDDYIANELKYMKEYGGSRLIVNFNQTSLNARFYVINIMSLNGNDYFLLMWDEIPKKFGKKPISKNKPNVIFSTSTARSYVNPNDDKEYKIDELIQLAEYKKDKMATGGKIKEGDIWEWHTVEYDPKRGNNYKFVKKVTIVEIDNKGQVVAQEVGSSRKFIIRHPEKYLKKKI
jgi:hypothetical protein